MNAAKPQFCTLKEGVITGSRWNKKCGVTVYELWASLFADDKFYDCSLLFNTPSLATISKSVLTISTIISARLSSTSASKTEAMSTAMVIGPTSPLLEA